MNLILFEDRPFTKPPVDPAKVGDGWEYDRASKFYGFKSVHDVTLDAFTREYPGDWASSHYLLTDDAFLYFLPALMKVATEARTAPGISQTYATMLGSSLLTALCRMARGEMEGRLASMLSGYSPEQVAVVARFVEEEVHWEGSEEFDDMRTALTYWKRFVTEPD